MELSYQTVCELRTALLVDKMIELDAAAYRDRLQKRLDTKPIRKKKRDPRGSKKGVKRGPYKKHH